MIKSFLTEELWLGVARLISKTLLRGRENMHNQQPVWPRAGQDVDEGSSRLSSTRSRHQQPRHLLADLREETRPWRHCRSDQVEPKAAVRRAVAAPRGFATHQAAGAIASVTGGTETNGCQGHQQAEPAGQCARRHVARGSTQLISAWPIPHRGWEGQPLQRGGRQRSALAGVNVASPGRPIGSMPALAQ